MKSAQKKNDEHSFDHEEATKKPVFVMQVHELDYAFDSPHLRNAFARTFRATNWFRAESARTTVSIDRLIKEGGSKTWYIQITKEDED